ncbi:MAG: colanic acid biosynthesis glycosyltransferase WcaL, partial [Candidatus Eiseniibacteriota bacterium]
MLREVMALRQRGIPLRIYSLMPPTRDARAHPEALALAGEVVVLPTPGLRALGRFASDLGACLRARPMATIRELLRVLVVPSRRRVRRLVRAILLAQRLRRDRIAHLHAAWAHTPASVARVACRLAGVPWSMGAHAKDIHLSRPSSLRKKLAAARFTTTCTHANQELLARIGRPDGPGLPPPPVLLHYHGVDTAYFDPEGHPVSPAPDGEQAAGEPPVEAAPATPLIVSVGRLVPKKGFDVLIDAAARLRARGVAFRLEILG